MQKRVKKVIKFESVNVTKTMTEAREEFLLNCRARDLVNETIMNYEKVTRYFMDFIGEESDIYDITSTDVDNYISDCLERTIGNTARTYCKLLKKYIYIRELKSSYNYLNENFCDSCNCISLCSHCNMFSAKAIGWEKNRGSYGGLPPF